MRRPELPWLAACLSAALLFAAAGEASAQQGRDRGRVLPDNAPKVGDAAPDFTLETLDGTSEVTLSGFQDKRPVCLIFGSYT